MSRKFKHFFINFYSFSSILCIKTKNGQFIPSKIRVFFNILAIIFGLLFLISYTTSKTFRKLFYADDVADLKQYSNLSNIILQLYNYSSLCGTYVLLFLQGIRYKKTLRFIELILDDDILSEHFNSIYKGACIKNLITLLFVQFLFLLPQFVAFLDFQKIYGVIFHFFSMYNYFPIIAFINLMHNFTIFVVLVLRQVRVDLKNLNEIKQNLKKLQKVTKIMENFQEVFGDQITLLTVDFIFIATILVN